MSDNVDINTIAYRALVASIARELTRQQIYEVAFIWLKGKGDISKYSTSEQNVCALELFASLECLGLFSFKNVSGLLEIAKSINRNDLVKKIEAYKKKKGDNSYGTRYVKKKDSTRSEERQHLEQTFEVMVTQMAFLEQQLSLLQSTLQKKTDSLLDEGMEIVQNSGAIVQELATNLTTVQKKFARRSRTDSSASRGSDTSKRSSGEMESAVGSFPLKESDQNSSANQEPVPSTLTQHVSVPKRNKPTPKPRSLKSIPTQMPIQESEGTVSELVHPSVENRSKSRHKPPVPPKKVFNRVHHSLRPPQDTSSEVAIEEQDCTGDSGMGTGSGSDQYGGLEEWKNAMQDPPPESEHSYQPLRRETTHDPEGELYQDLNHRNNYSPF